MAWYLAEPHSRGYHMWRRQVWRQAAPTHNKFPDSIRTSRGLRSAVILHHEQLKSGQRDLDQGELVERLSSLSLSSSPSSSTSTSSPGRVEMLKEISEEQKFEVTFVDIEEVAKSGRMQCLVRKIWFQSLQKPNSIRCRWYIPESWFQVQLSTLPVAVCFGDGENHAWPIFFLLELSLIILTEIFALGETVDEAQESAATNALEYLQMMIKWSKTVATQIVCCIYDDLIITVILNKVFVCTCNCVCCVK